MDNDCTYGNFNPTVSLLKILHKPGRQNSQGTHSEQNRIILETRIISLYQYSLHAGTHDNIIFSFVISGLITSVNQLTLSHCRTYK